MNVLVIGGGGREHVLCWTLSRTATVFCAPGNAGTLRCATNLPIAANDIPAILDAVASHHIDLTVVGPEAPLASGLVDRLAGRGFPAFGPTAAAARIEASKAFAKQIMARAGVPTAASQTFTDEAAAVHFIDGHPEPLVVKASGLAGGKGAVVCSTRHEARAAVHSMFAGRFGDAGSTVIVEDFLEGEELSVFALTDGERIMMLPSSQDHKRLQEGDRGPNTGGMGAYAPVSLASDALVKRIGAEIIIPTLQTMAEEGAPYRGVLYAGLMISPDGAPAVIEFNCRFGDPEAQVVLPVLDGELLDPLLGIAADPAWRPPRDRFAAVRAAVTTVLAAPGYPEAPRKGGDIRLPAELPENTLLFHAGTRIDQDAIRVSGGRVLCATGLGPDVAAAAAASRELAEMVDFEGKAYRRDIAWREVARAGVA